MVRWAGFGRSVTGMSDSGLTDLRGRGFERADMTEARFAGVRLNGAVAVGPDAPPAGRAARPRRAPAARRGAGTATRGDGVDAADGRRADLRGARRTDRGRWWAPGWPDEGATFPVRECLLVVRNEEWRHLMYAERDLAVLEEGD
jgi:hypothetical protein